MTSSLSSGDLRAASCESLCPTEQQLRQLLAAELTETEQARLTVHLDGCPPCRDVVGRLAGDLPLPALPTTAASAPEESALLRIVERIKDESPTSGFESHAGCNGPATLDFLAPSDDPAHLGRLGRYVVQEEIGRGASGIVLRAQDERLGRIVALKVLSPRLATNEHARRRFVREARAAAAIRDDHVIGIHHVEEVDGLPFLVMEYVVGRSLGQRLDADGPLPVPDILRIGGQIARGLAAAHAQGLVHRDIKPANILLENGVERVKITDFGLAHAVDDVRTTQPGVVIGTPEYMSPEQARGERVDHRSDLFSLGSVLYAMCAGRPPFRAESTMAILRRVCEDTPRPLPEINPEIPGWLVDLIDKLIAKDAADRFRTAAEVAELLEQCLAHVQQCGAGVPPAIPVGHALRGVPRAARYGTEAASYRSPRRWPLAAAILLLLTATLALAETTGVTAVTASVIRIVRGDGTLVVEIDDPNIQVLLDGEELVITGAGPKELRLRPGQHELHTVKDGKPVETKLITITRDGRQVVKVAREQPAPAGPSTRQVWADAVDFGFSGAPSPDGKYLSYMDWTSGDVAVRELATGTNRRLTNQGWPEYPGESVFSPDSQQVAFSVLNKDGVYELRLIGLDGSGLRILYPNKGKEVQYLVPSDWSADGKFILASFVKREAGQFMFMSQIVLVSVVDGSVRILKTLDGEIKGKMVLSPDGRYVAYSAYPQKTSRQRDIFLLATDGSGVVPLLEHAADDFVLGWAPDGKRVVFASDRTGAIGIWLIAVAEGKPQGAPELVKAEMGQFHAMGLTRSGSFYYGLFSGGQNVYTATLDLEQGKLLTPPVEAIQRGEGFNWAPAWSPDGRYLACLSHRQGRPPLFYIRSVESNEVRELAPNLRGGLNVHSLHWSPDGQALLGAGNNEEEWGALRIDVQTGAVTTLVRGAGRGLFYPHWAANAKAIFYTCVVNDARRIFRWDLETSVEQELYQTPTRWASKWWTLSPDGQQFAFSVEGALMVLPATGGEPRELVKGEGPISTVAWTPDGRHLLFPRIIRPGPDGGPRRELWRVPAAGGEPQKLEITLPNMGHLRIHPDGRQIAFTGKPQVASTGKLQPDKTEVWVLENFLPPLAASKPAVADASTATSKAAAAAANAPAAVAREQAAPVGPTARQVWAGAGNFGAVSPDGKYLGYVDWESGDVGVRDLATGTSRRLLNQGYPEFAESCIFSPDSKQVAYSWFNKGVYELRTIGLDGSRLRVLYSPKENERTYVKVNDWSADGKYILANFSVRNEPGPIVLVSVVDGSVRVLKTQNTWWETMCLSPDGRYVAYSVPPQTPSRQRDIFLLATDGSGEVPLVQHAADDEVLGWAPDGKRLLFTSDRSGNLGIWMITIADGKPYGAATLVKPEMGRFNSLGLTRSGSFYYGLHFGGQNVYTATLDPESGKVLSPPVVAIERSEGFNWSPAWSPDGKYLACLSSRRVRAPLIYIQAVETGDVRELVAPSLRGVQTNRLHWSGDGTALVCAGYTEEGRGPLKIDVQTGAVTTLARGGYNPFLSPDGRALFFQKAAGVRRLIRRDMETGNEQVVYENEPEEAGHFTLSPDGSQLAFAEHGGLKLLPATGGKSQELLKAEKPIKVTHCTVAWTPDGRFVLFGRPNDEGAGELWRVPVTGGEAQKIDVMMSAPLEHLRIHPDGRQIAFNAKAQPAKSEVWALENFLPPLADSKPPAAADASAATSKSAATASVRE